MQTSEALLNYGRRGFNMTVELAVKDQPKQRERLARSVSTNETIYKVSQYSGFGQSTIIEEGEAFPADSRVVAGSLDVTPYMIGNGFGCTKQAKVTDYYNLIVEGGKMLSKGHNDTKELIVANIYNRAFHSSYTGPDSLELCSTSHTAATGALGGNTQSNYGDGANSIALSTANVETAITQMRKRRDHRGLKAPILGGLRLLVDPTLEPLAYRICNSMGMQGTANNDVNFIRAGSASLKPEVYYQFSSTTAWFLVPDSISDVDAFVLTRIPLTTESDYKVENKTFIFTIGEEIGTFWNDWRWIQGSPGT